MYYKIKLLAILLLGFMGSNAQNINEFPLTVKAQPAAKHIIFYLSGDGGMNSFSQNLTSAFHAKNYAVVSLDSKKYFWDQKSPEKLTQDLAKIIEHYLKNWDKEEFSILGYSFGADAALFLSHRLPKELQARLKSTILLSPSASTDLEVRLTDMMGFGSKEAKYKVLPEINKINSRMLFIFGQDEDSAFYKSIPEKKNITKTQLPGSHKFDNDIKKVVLTIQTVL